MWYIHSMLGHPQKILVLKFGALGDLILVTPTLRRLRKNYPNAFISLLCLEKYKDVLENCPYLDEVLTFNKSFLIHELSLVRDIRKRNFDLLIDIQNSKRSHTLGMLFGIPRRLGFKRDFGRYFLTQGSYGFNNDLSPVKHQFQILESLNLKEDTEKLEVYCSEEDEKKVEGLWEGMKGRVIGIHPFASSRWKSKVWPTTSYVELAQEINEFFKETVFVLTGSQQDFWRGEELRLMLKNVNCVNLMGKTTYGELVALIKRLNYFITVDSAPLHIATALDTLTLAFFGPTNPKKHYVPTEKTKLLYREVPCGPCYKPICPEVHHKCLKGISAKDVAEVWLEIGRAHV